MLLAAAIVLSLLGFFHSVLGEHVIFRTLRMQGSILVALATRGRRLGWVGFLAAGLLCWLGA